MITDEITPLSNDTAAAVDLPVRDVRPPRARTMVGDAIATIAGAVGAALFALLAWLWRRGHIVVPAAVTLTAVPLVELATVEAAPEPSPMPMTPESFADAPGAGMPMPAETTPTTQRVDQEPIVQMPRKPILKPKPPLPLPRTQAPSQPAIAAPTARQLAELYTQVGRTLAAASKKDPDATLDLWPRYRWVNFMEAIKTPEKRAAAAALLDKLLADAKKLAP